jgi:SAM-dependent methyltransferase
MTSGGERAMGAGYAPRRGWVAEYFDRTASAAWARLTSEAPVSGVRASVRAGRERMRAVLTGWLPADLDGVRVLDAGCGPGTLAIELAARGAHVVAVDLSPTLVALARERAAALPGAANIRGTSATCSTPRSAASTTWWRWTRCSPTRPTTRRRRSARWPPGRTARWRPRSRPPR